MKCLDSLVGEMLHSGQNLAPNNDKKMNRDFRHQATLAYPKVFESLFNWLASKPQQHKQVYPSYLHTTLDQSPHDEMQRIGTLQRGNNSTTHSGHDPISNQAPPSLGPDLEQRAARILELLSKLEASVQDLMSLAWEQEYERRDMLEHIDDLNHLIKATVAMMKPGGSEQLSSEAMTALGRYFDQRVLVEKAKNWELAYQCRDLQEDLWKLQLQLRSSIPVEDVTHPPLKPRTAMEKALAVRIVELEDKLRNPKGRGRSCSM